jgi:hypothetical protein
MPAYASRIVPFLGESKSMAVTFVPGGIWWLIFSGAMVSDAGTIWLGKGQMN